MTCPDPCLLNLTCPARKSAYPRLLIGTFFQGIFIITNMIQVVLRLASNISYLMNLPFLTNLSYRQSEYSLGVRDWRILCLLCRIPWPTFGSLCRASDFSRKKNAKFRGIFRGKFAEKSADFAGFSREKSQNSRKIGRFRRIFAGKKSKFAENRPISQDFRGRKVKICRKISRFCGILAEKSQITKDFHGQILRKIG